MAKAKTPAKPRAPRTKANVPGGSAAGKGAHDKGHNGDLPFADMQNLFLSHRGKILAQQAKVDAEKTKLDDIFATARGDGFTKKMFDCAAQLATTKGESAVKGDLEMRLTVASYIGHGLANQLDLFVHGAAGAKTTSAERSVDQAYADGKAASAGNQAAKPDAAPGTPMYDAYMQGFHDHGTAGLGTGTPAAKPN